MAKDPKEELRRTFADLKSKLRLGNDPIRNPTRLPDLQPRSRSPHPLFLWARGAGLGSLLVGGAGLMTGISFWLFCGFLCLGAVVLGIDPWFDPSFRTRWIGWRVLTSLMMLVFFVLGIYLIVLPAPLMVNPMDRAVEYDPGTEIAGIQWRPDFSELRVILGNSTEQNYTNLDLYVTVDIPAVAVKQLTINPNCTVELVGIPEGFESRGGRIHATKVIGGINRARLICDRFPKRSNIEVVFVCAQPPFGETRAQNCELASYVLGRIGGGLKEDESHETKLSAEKVCVKGTYESLGGRPNRIEQTFSVRPYPFGHPF